jgi:hypothetical protein
MSVYFFRIRNSKYSGTSDQGTEHTDRDAAWIEMTRVCGDLVGGVCDTLKPNTEWRMELLDDSKKPVFRIRLVAESFN